jgi:hypothetical protein
VRETNKKKKMKKKKKINVLDQYYTRCRLRRTWQKL